MIPASFMNDRVGPMCRTVEDVARVLDVISGYDPKDELTAFGVGRKPQQSYESYARKQPLKGVRIGVVREYMNKELFTQADSESIDIVDREINTLRKLGATVVDPGKGGALFQSCVKKYGPASHAALFIKQFPKLFPVDASGKPAADHVPLLVSMFFDPSLFPEGPSFRDLGNDRTVGEGKYVLDKYLKGRGDANIQSTADLIEKSRFYSDVRKETGFSDKKESLLSKQKDMTFDISSRLQTRFALQQIGIQCMAEMNLDAVTYPTGNVPAPKLGAPTEPSINGRSALAWTLLGANGFPAISVPAGFTTQVFDRVADANGSTLIGPIAAKLPVGIDFLGKPFDEPTLLKIAAAYEGATKHRTPPAGFGPVAGEP
jgi:Asp-tRNA(Asn)/Glu-tRNA(Gln) amidotransferase A subunit family amidase